MYTAAVLAPALILGLPVAFLLLLVPNSSPAQAACTPTSGGPFKADEVPNGWGTAVSVQAKVSGVPAAVLAAQLEIESGWNPRAVSPAGAQGLAQFMPATWAQYGQGDPFDAMGALQAQGRYMKALMDIVSPMASMPDTQVRLALAAYNAGPGAVQTHKGIPPFAETKKYVEGISGLAQTKYAGGCSPAPGSLIGELGSGTWVSPLPGGTVTSMFGPRGCPPGTDCNAHVLDHKGIDLAKGGNATVVAPADMRITVAEKGQGWRSAYGTYLVARQVDAPGLVFEFHHLAHGSLMVKAGDTVAAGTPLGTEGTTGNSSGVHLHFQIASPDAPDGESTADWAVDPYPILKAKGILP